MKTKTIFLIKSKRRLLLLFLLTTYLFLLSCSKTKPIKTITTSFEDISFYHSITSYQSYQNNYLDLYYQSYLQGNTIIEALNQVNYPDFLTSTHQQPAKYYHEIFLVNKNHYLDSYYVPDQLVEVSQVSYVVRPNEVMLIDKTALMQYQKMANDAKLLGIDFVIFSAYRTYERQVEIYNQATDLSYIARPGESEHQTGLAIDISTYQHGLTTHFENSLAWSFLVANCYRYGFILRYPSDKTMITGYAYEPWHFRYVGSIAYDIYLSGLSLEEYIYHYLEITE